MTLKIKFTLCLLFLTAPLVAQKEVRLTSPDGNIVFTLNLKSNKASYSVAYQNNTLIKNSALHLVFEDTRVLKNPVIDRQPVFSEVNENYELVVGKAKKVNSHYKQVTIPLQGIKSYRVNLEVRAFNDGIAFRYVLPKQNKSSYTLLQEQTEFKFTADPIVKALLLPNYTSSHEGLYTTLPLSKVKEDTLMDMPALFQFPNQTYVAITEAALVDYAGMYLIKHNGILAGNLSPLPGQTNIKVKAVSPGLLGSNFKSPP